MANPLSGLVLRNSFDTNQPRRSGRIAQTVAARVTVVVIRDDIKDLLSYHLLTDSASAAYVWDSLLDAMAEFGGRPVGLSALKSLA